MTTFPRLLDVSYYRPRNCYRKKHNGAVYYLATGGICKGDKEDDPKGYERALLEWAGKLRELTCDESRPDTSTSGRNKGNRSLEGALLDEAAKLRNQDEEATTEERTEIYEFLDRLNARNQRSDTIHQHDTTPTIAALMASPNDYLSSELPSRKRKEFRTSLRGVLNAYLEERRGDSDRGEIAPATYKGDRDNLEDFACFAEHFERHLICNIDEGLLHHYQQVTKEGRPYIKRLRRGKTITEHEMRTSPRTAQKRLQAVRVFMEWAYRNAYTETLPRNIDRRYARIKLPDPTPTLLTVSEVRELFNVAATRNKYSRTKSRRPALFVALGLNCGYGPTDIATLTHDEIDWDSEWGVVIRRKRHKTDTPQCHKLWGVTTTLLREEMTNPLSHKFVLLAEDGGPLELEDVDRKITNTNRVGRSIERVRRKLIDQGKAYWNEPRKGIGALRKTSADLLKKKYPAMPQIYRQFLGRKTTGEAGSRVDRHYVKEHYEPLFTALDWLATEYDLKLTESA